MNSILSAGGVPKTPMVEQILSRARSTVDRGIVLLYQKWSTVGSVLLAWNAAQTALLMRSSKGNHFFVLKQPSGGHRIEPVSRRDAEIFFEKAEREILSREAFPAEAEKGEKVA